jgi:hypothetical protein
MYTTLKFLNLQGASYLYISRLRVKLWTRWQNVMKRGLDICQTSYSVNVYCGLVLVVIMKAVTSSRTVWSHVTFRPSFYMVSVAWLALTVSCSRGWSTCNGPFTGPDSCATHHGTIVALRHQWGQRAHIWGNDLLQWHFIHHESPMISSGTEPWSSRIETGVTVWSC